MTMMQSLKISFNVKINLIENGYHFPGDVYLIKTLFSRQDWSMTCRKTCPQNVLFAIESKASAYAKFTMDILYVRLAAVKNEEGDARVVNIMNKETVFRSSEMVPSRKKNFL